MKQIAQFITPIIFLCISIALFLFIIQPSIAQNKVTASNLEELQSSRDKIDIILGAYDTLEQKFKTITPEQTAVLDKALPSNINNVRLILELERIARDSEMTFKDVKVTLEDKTQEERKENRTTRPVTVELTVVGTYEQYLNYLASLEKSLRILSLKKVDFNIPKNQSTSDQHEFSLQLETYWFVYSPQQSLTL
jgi:Tfp pilus assembly protein PilO